MAPSRPAPSSSLEKVDMSPNARRERRRASAEDRRPLKLHHAFGSQADAGALLLNDDLVMHRVGRWLVSQSIETTAVSTKLSKMSFFFELAPTVTKLTALCTDQNRNFLALCETSHQPDSSEQPSPPQLRIIHSQTHRTICVLSAALDGNFAGCCFSQDGKYVLAYTGEPDHVIVVWHWVEERPLGMFRSRSPLTRVGFNPATSSLLSMCSPMRLARLNESGHFKEIEVSALKRYGGAATDHVWLAAKALVFLDSGTARVVEDSALKQSITREGCVPIVIEKLPLTNGFVCGCVDGQVIAYKKPDKAGEFRLMCAVRGPAGMGPVRGLHVGERERNVLVMCNEVCLLLLKDELARARQTNSEEGITTLDKGASLVVPLDAVDAGTDETVGEPSEAMASAEEDTSGRYEQLLTGAHTARIVALSCAVCKPILVSGSEDRTIRVWDLSTLTCQFSAVLPEAAHSLTVHPDGMQLCVAYENRLSLYHISLDSLLSWRDVPMQQAGKVVSYSHGGHLLAASQGNSVHVFDSYTIRRLAALSGHLAPVTALSWASDDSAFTTGGADGMLYTWSCEGPMRRIHECRLYKNAAVVSVAVISDPRDARTQEDEDEGANGRPSSRGGGDGSGGSRGREHGSLAVGGDGAHAHQQAQAAARRAELDVLGDVEAPIQHKAPPPPPSTVLRLVERNDENAELTLQQPEASSSLCMITTLHAARVALIGTSSGAIYTISVSARDDGDKLRQRGLPGRPHFGAVSALVATHDERLLFSASDDGSLFAYRLADALGGGRPLVPRASSRSAQVDRSLSYTDVQCVSREMMEQMAQELADSRSAYTVLQASVKTDLTRMELRLQSQLSSAVRDHSEALADSEKRLRTMAAQHNSEVASLQRRFAEFATRAEEKRRGQQSHLEMCLKKEISTHDQVTLQLEEEQERAAEEAVALADELEAARLAKVLAEREHFVHVDGVKAEHEQALAVLEKTAEARQLQLIDEYDQTLVQERHESESTTDRMATEIKSLTMQQYMIGKKVKKYAQEKEAMDASIRKKEKEAAEAASEIRDLHSTINRLRSEAVERERVISDQEKRTIAMHGSMQRLESNKQLLELRVKELEDVHEPMMVQLYDLKMTSSRVEAELLVEGNARKKKENEVAMLHQKVERLNKELAKAEQRAVDATNSHLSTISKLFVQIEQKATLATLAEWVRSRDKQLGLDQEGRAGQARGSEDIDDHEKVRRELVRQRDKLHTTVDQLTAELQRSKNQSRASINNLSAEAQRAHEQLNEARRQAHELTQELEVTKKSLAWFEQRAKRNGGAGKLDAGRASLRLADTALCDVAAGAPPLQHSGPSPFPGGLKMSATTPSLRPSGAAPAATEDVSHGNAYRPITAPPPIVPLSVALSAAPKMPDKQSLPFEMTEQIERHVLENQRLREQLLFYTSQTSTKMAPKKKRHVTSLGMPLPPV